MSAANIPTAEHESAFDAIAALLPPATREQFYRRMAHLSRLPPDDEMLQIAEAMGYLALLIRDTPVEIAREREQLNALLGAGLSGLQRFQQATIEYHKSLDARLLALPTTVATGIAPEKIAATIRESLRQKFAETGMEDTAKALNVLSDRMRQASAELARSVSVLDDPRAGTVHKITRGLDRIEQKVETAVDHITAISSQLYTDVKRSVLWLSGCWFVLGFLIGILFWHWKSS